MGRNYRGRIIPAPGGSRAYNKHILVPQLAVTRAGGTLKVPTEEEVHLADLRWWIAGFGLAYLLFLIASRNAALVRAQYLLVVLVAYSGGVLVGEVARESLSLQGRVLDRLFFSVPILVMAIPAFILYPELRARFANARAYWWDIVANHHGAVIAIAALMMAAGAIALGISIVLELSPGAEPWWPFMGDVLALSLLNGFSEEVIFRGFILAALLICAPPRQANAIQALLFALLHLGASPSFIGSFGSLFVLFLLAMLLGTLALRRGGLFLVIAIHMAIDIAGLSVALRPTA